MNKHKDVKKILLSNRQIEKRISEMANQVSKDYAQTYPLMICILKGSSVFFTRLLEQMSIEAEMEFIAISTYGKGTTSSGEVRLLKDLDVPLDNRDVVVVEDIVDSGVTLNYLIKLLKARGAKTVEICCLLSKQARRRIELDIKYIGYEIEDEFVVGYGLDFNERYRNLNFIGVLKPEMYKS